MTAFFRKLRWFTERRRKEDELAEELQFHLDEETELRRAEGLSTDQARWAARRDLGNLTCVQESTRATWTWLFFDQLVQDLRYALRMMVNNRGFTALAVLSLALGIGANTAIYSFMDSMLLRSLPVADPASLVVLNWHSKDPREMGKAKGNWAPHVMHGMSGHTYDDPRTGMTTGIFPFPIFELFTKSDAVFSSLFAYYPSGTRTLTINGQAGTASGEYVSGEYFRGLAVAPAAGRLIVPEDDRAGASPIAVISFAFSQGRFGGPANATGQSILVDNVPFTVAGVTAPEFYGVDPAAAPDLYLPMHTNLLLDGATVWAPTPPNYVDQNYYWIEIMGRLRPGVSLAQAQAVLAPPFHQWVAGTATNDDERANLPALLVKEGAGGLENLRRQYSKPLYVLLTIVSLILALACANTANLLLARAAARKREMALRLSLGAGRPRVMRQLFTESVLLASLGGALGVLFAVWGVRSLTLLLSNGQENFTLRAELNWHVLSATLALSLLSGVLFGLAPAIQSTRADLMPALKENRVGEPRTRARYAFLRMNLSHALVAFQIAISLLILVAAGLFGRTLSNLQSVQLGFNGENVLLFQLNAQQVGHREPEIVTFYADLRKRFEAIPGVRHASFSHSSLIGAGRQLPISVSGTPARGTRILNTGPGYLTTMQIPILLGREIGERDQPSSPPVAVVNDLFARTNFGRENPVGRHISLGGSNGGPRDMEIIGVCTNARYGGLKRDIPPVVFIPYNQGTFPPVQQMTYALRTAGDPLLYLKTVRKIVHQADARVPLTNVKTQAAEIDQTINQEITFAKLCTGFAILALVIACVGLYGTMSYTVARRTGEIGIRMALGARRGTVLWMVLREVFVLAAVGLAVSLPTALGTSNFIKSFLFGMQPNDPWALSLAVVILLGAALLAGYVPARRASRIDPMIALRHE
jgi:macrolide transport system ATP-binding/permease protein